LVVQTDSELLEQTASEAASAPVQGMMKAVVYGGPGKKSLEMRPKPELRSPGDAIVRMVKTTI